MDIGQHQVYFVRTILPCGMRHRYRRRTRELQVEQRCPAPGPHSRAGGTYQRPRTFLGLRHIRATLAMRHMQSYTRIRALGGSSVRISVSRCCRLFHTGIAYNTVYNQRSASVVLTSQSRPQVTVGWRLAFTICNTSVPIARQIGSNTYYQAILICFLVFPFTSTVLAIRDTLQPFSSHGCESSACEAICHPNAPSPLDRTGTYYWPDPDG